LTKKWFFTIHSHYKWASLNNDGGALNFMFYLYTPSPLLLGFHHYWFVVGVVLAALGI